MYIYVMHNYIVRSNCELIIIDDPCHPLCNTQLCTSGAVDTCTCLAYLPGIFSRGKSWLKLDKSFTRSFTLYYIITVLSDRSAVTVLSSLKIRLHFLALGRIHWRLRLKGWLGAQVGLDQRQRGKEHTTIHQF